MPDTRITATDYVLERSWTCRRWRKHTCWLVREAIEFLPHSPKTGERPEPWRERLREHLCRSVADERIGNPVLIFILLNIVIPIVVRLVIEWWLNRREG